MRFLRPILYMVFMGAACTGTSEYHKRTSGFTGIRSKRSILQEEHTPEKDGQIVINEKETNLEIQKRALSELTEAEDKPFNGWIEDSDFQEGGFKRAPSAGFFGMRGKKYFYDQWPDKRAKLTNNFFGMRGKKQQLYELSPNDLQYSSDKRLAPAGFMGMHGRKPYEQEDMTQQNEISNDYIDDAEDKRAPKYSASFFGMRGKKGDDEILGDGIYVGSEELMSEAEKRARNLFFGMRGRRDLGNKEIVDEKRAYNAFFGMRGKRVYEDYLDDPSMHALYGMRGKKHRGRSNFFGMRGKKLPLEYRDKFVGVRGKKSTKPSDMAQIENNEKGIELQRVNNKDLDNLMFLFDEDTKSTKQVDDDYNTLKQSTMTDID